MSEQEIYNAYHTEPWFFELYYATKKAGKYDNFQYMGMFINVNEVYNIINK